MNDNAPAMPPAGWYPDSTRLDLQRYWDGTAWTGHTAPLGGAPGPTAPAMAPTSPSGAASAAAPKSGSLKWWLIGAGAAVLLLVVGIGVGAGNRSGDSAEAGASLASPSAAATPAPSAASPAVEPATAPVESAPAPPAPVVDAAAFTADADSQLDDVDKDLNDMIITLNEDGFWRLLSNYGELSFNLGQLQSLTPSPNVAEEWNAQLAQLEVTFDSVGDSISTNDNATVRAAVEAASQQSAILREVASRAAQ